MKKLKALATVFIFMLMLMLLPPMRADITQSNEFVEPIKNWSFEERHVGSPGVYGAPHWEQGINVGYRELRGDANGDGVVDENDMENMTRSELFSLVTLLDVEWSYASPERRDQLMEMYHACDLLWPSAPTTLTEYDWTMDFDGNGVVDSDDLSIFSQDWGKTATRLDGKYSWFVKATDFHYGIGQVLDDVTRDAVIGKRISFSFWLKRFDASCGYVCAVIDYEYDGNLGEEMSEYFTPPDDNWYNVHVEASLPWTTTAISVLIETGVEFKAWIDLASLGIVTSAQITDSKGNLAVSAMLYQWKIRDDVPSDYPKGEAFLSVGLFADSNIYNNWAIRSIELKIEILEGSGAPSMEDALHIWECGQANDWGYEVDPEEVEEFQNQLLWTGEIAVGVIVGTTIGIVTMEYPVWGLFIGAVSGGIIDFTFAHIASDPNVRDGSGIGGNVLERWPYPVGPLSSPDFVSDATGHYRFDWRFFTEHASSFKIRVTAKVEWGFIAYSYGMWNLPYAGTLETYTEITINA